jgi:hypothetical protein
MSTIPPALAPAILPGSWAEQSEQAWQEQLLNFRRNVVEKHQAEWKFYNGCWHKWNGGGYYPYVRDFIAYPINHGIRP